MGALVDSEDDGQSSSQANGDDKSEDDEDGVSFPSPLIIGTTTNIPVEVFNDTGVDAILYWFIDFDGNGNFSGKSESGKITVPSSASPQTININIDIPLDADTKHNLGARFRLSTNKRVSANGPTTDGEIEDYLINVVSPAYCLGQLSYGFDSQ